MLSGKKKLAAQNYSSHVSEKVVTVPHINLSFLDWRATVLQLEKKQRLLYINSWRILLPTEIWRGHAWVCGWVGSGDSVRFGSTSYKYALERVQVFCFVISLVKNGLLITCSLITSRSKNYIGYELNIAP